MKKIIGISAVFLSVFLFTGCGEKKSESQGNMNQEQEQVQAVLEDTYRISKEYVALRYQTDNLLFNAKDYSYKDWNNEMTRVISLWENLEKEALELEKSAGEMAEEKADFSFVPAANAYNREEISNVFDKAPAGKKIATLAKYLGVDAKRAFQILKQDQAQVEADAWNEAGDTFKKLENSAIVIKDGCKVAGFVGGVVLSGGTSAIAAGSALTKAAVVISGADLALEVTEDSANIALGNGNKISAIAGEARKTTAPIATILTITDIPNNLKTGFEKFNAVMVGLDQFRGAAQEGQVVGVSLPVYNPKEKHSSMQVSVLNPEELGSWLKENKAEMKNESKEEVEKILGIGTSKGEEKTIVEENKPLEENKNTTDNTASEAINSNFITHAEFNDMSDNDKFKTMAKIKQFFGEPDHSGVNKNGRRFFIYLDRIKSESGTYSGVRFSFYTLEDYKKIADSAFGWDEDYQEIWDDSGGGLTASTEVRTTEALKNEYGL